MNKKQVVVSLIVVTLLGVFITFDLASYFNVDFFQSQRQNILAYKDAHFWLSSLLYFVLYIVVAALSLPAAGILTIVGGAVFGLTWGMVLVSFGSTIGATLAFLMARTLLRDWVQKKFGSSLSAFNTGMEKDGNFYLFTLRLIPGVPFVLVNLLMGLTPIKATSFYWVSQLGMLFGTALYVNFGATLGVATSLSDVMSGGVIGAISILIMFPWLAKWAMNYHTQHKILKPFKKPRQFDNNMIVIGAGAAGLVTSLIASVVKAKVTLIEKHQMGGDCLNTGCVPSKALIKSASVNHLISRSAEFGLNAKATKVDFPAIMARVKNVIKAIEPHDSVERYSKFGVNCIQGEAKITSPYSVEVNGKEITTRNIVIATGARPLIPSIPGLDKVDYLTSDTIWELQQLPKKLLVLGGGPIGCELAQAFARLGSKVTQLDQANRILAREDEEVSAYVTNKFINEGIELLTNHVLVEFRCIAGKNVALASVDGIEVSIDFDYVLIAVGRKANTEGFGLENLSLPLRENGTIEVNQFLQTNYPNIYACGDVTGPYQFTHMASFQAWYASINSLFSGFRKYKVNYSVVPWATFTDPEVARVGLNESDAKQQGIDYEVTRFDIDDLDRAIVDSEAHGFVKILTKPGKDKILGVTIVGYHASELITEFVSAMTHGLGLKKILSTIHIYPTLSESNKFAASEWRKKNAPKWVFPYLEKFHSWRRS